MTVVNLTGLETLLGAPGPIKRGEVTVTYWAGDREFIAVDGERVIFPPPIRVGIVDGDPAAVLDLRATAGVCCVRWDVRSFNGGYSLPTRYTSIPADGPVDFGDLVQVDPGTFAPADDPATVLGTVRSELLDGIRLERITQAAYDLLPTPRPDDVLYVITP